MSINHKFADREKEQGNIIITIMIVMFLSMLAASGLISHNAVTEARAIEQSLVKVRAYWAMMGHVNYILSRARTKGSDGVGNELCYENVEGAGAWCTGSDDTKKKDALEQFVVATGEIGNIKEWSYDKNNGNFKIKTEISVADVDDSVNDGKIKITSKLNDISGDNKSAISMVNKIPKIELTACFGKAASADSDCNGSGKYGGANITSFIRSF